MTDGREGTLDMLKLLLIATFTLGTFALAQAADNSDKQSAGDWYNQQLSAQVQQFAQIAAAIAPEATATSESGTPPPASMASNANDDWYNQVLAREAEQSALTKAAIGTPSKAGD